MNGKQLLVAGAVIGALATGAGVLVLSAGDASANRVDTWLSSSVAVQTVHLQLAPDGGCQASVLATYSKTDGGAVQEQTSFVDLTGAAQTACLNMVTVHGLALFRAAQGI